ncbi:MAG: hypothetical protein HOP14_04340 [Acidobacteria bacterium]|nr:hypothetical protein [Acidobacteriota bacterium]
MKTARTRVQTSRRATLRLGGVLLALAMAAPLSLYAHHGWGGYLDQDFEVTGTVTAPVNLAGPHGALKIRADGQIWDVVLAPPNRTERAGLTEDIIPMGATVTAHGHRHRDPNRFEIKTERLTWNNRVFNVYPDRD